MYMSTGHAYLGESALIFKGSFHGLLAHLGTSVRNTMRRVDAGPSEGAFTLTTRPNPKQRQAIDLAAAIAV
jgi:hypothetical protein